MAAVIVVAGAIGVGVTLALTRASATPAAAAPSPSTPGTGASAPSTPGAGGLAPGAAGGAAPNPGNEESEISMLGTVTAVGPASITIGGNGLSVTATVTGATRVSGRVTSIGQIKVGDRVSAQMTQSGSKVTAVAIEYPAEQYVPGQAGGGLP